MKLQRVLHTALCLAVSVVIARSQEAKTSDAEKAAKAQTEAYVAAFNKADTKALATMYAEDVQYTMDDGTVYSGRTAVADGLTKYFAKNKGAKLELSVESARFLTPDVLLEKGFATVGTTEGEPEVTRYTATYLKKGDTWQIAQLDEVELPPTDAAAQALGELDWLVGSWKDNTPGITVDTRVTWAAGNHFLRRSFTITREGDDPVEGTEVIGYDAARGQVRSWQFDSEGGIGESVWRQDGNKWLIKTAATAADGTVTTAENVITSVDAKKYTWESVNRVSGGETLPNIDKIEVVRAANH